MEPENAVEALMREELAKVEEQIKENQKKYKELQKEKDAKRKALNLWLRPTVKPRYTVNEPSAMAAVKAEENKPEEKQ